ncbi:MAG: hypothetical protein QOE70_3706 [Chthoniobacter sp.]|nr:hypothetical protein [Chthoniobacter sp.]
MRIHRQLEARLYRGAAFIDLESIHPGPFPDRIERAIAECRAALVIIGKGWLMRDAQSAKQRLDDPADWVRKEVGLILQRALSPCVVH